MRTKSKVILRVKPCPFCESQYLRVCKKTLKDVGLCYFIKCKECLSQGPLQPELEHAVIFWNCLKMVKRSILRYTQDLPEYDNSRISGNDYRPPMDPTPEVTGKELEITPKRKTRKRNPEDSPETPHC